MTFETPFLGRELGPDLVVGGVRIGLEQGLDGGAVGVEKLVAAEAAEEVLRAGGGIEDRGVRGEDRESG